MQQSILSPALQAYLDRGLEHFRLPGLSVGILSTTGNAPALECTEAAGAPVRYKIGSLTKLVTGLLVLALQEDGLLQLDDTAVRYLPEFGRQTQGLLRDGITIRDLLLHTSGLPRGPLFQHNPSQDDVLDWLNTVGLPNTRRSAPAFKYSNIGYILLGFIAEAVAGKPYAALVRERLLDPLGMTRSGFGRAGGLAQAYGPSYFSGTSQTPFDSVAMPLHDAPQAAFDLHASVADFSRLLACILNDGMYEGTRIFSPGSIRQLLHDAWPITSQLQSTIGLMRLQSFGGPLYFQNAEHWGHSASMLLLPEKGLGIVALANRGSAALELWSMIQAIARHMVDGPGADRLTYDYRGRLDLTGTYRSETAPELVIRKTGPRLMASAGGDAPVPLVSAGRNSFLYPQGVLRRYLLTAELRDAATVQGLTAGPHYYHKDAAAAPQLLQYPALTGVYANATAGRVAVFERNGQLILAYSPSKEAVLSPRAPDTFLQITGPFPNETVVIREAAQELCIGALTFTKAPHLKI